MTDLVDKFRTTNEFAEIMGIRPQSIRKRHFQTGSYFSVRPIKMPNGRLLWKFDDIIDFLENGKS